MKFLIMGCGRVGSGLARSLADEGHDVTIMDVRQDAFRRLTARFRGNAIIGDGLDSATLQRAGIENADVFVSVTQGDNRNLMAAQVAKHIFKVPRVIARVYDDSRADVFRELGLQTLSSPRFVTSLMRDMIFDESGDTPEDG
ncbi:MAG: TrkA family potassium uptake protein [Dehalococcoidia bacterium]|nr:TrkA family potassium uptake protein [Dehalococcoidia bacterium]